MHATKAERELALQRVLHASGAGKNQLARTVAVLCADHKAVLERALPRDRVIQGAFARLESPSARQVFGALLLHLASEGCDGVLEHVPYVQGVAMLATKAKYFVRDPLAWQRPGRNMHRQFSSLLRHCLAHYDVPAFMDQAWCEADAQSARNWFIDIGRGYNIRHSRGLPFVLTKRMAHQFIHAPDDLRIEEALRWAQVTGQGGDDRLARAIIATRLGRNGFAHEHYWGGVVRFFIAHPLERNGKLSEVVDLLAHRLDAGEPVNIAGRTAASITRLSDEWHRTVIRAAGTLVDRRWQPSGLLEGAYTTGKAQERLKWKVTELLSLQALAAEGRALQHCVATYVTACSRRVTAIFSITAEDVLGNVERLGTIEVQISTSRVVQAKAKRNTQLGAAARAVLEKWAQREHLTINDKL